MECDGKFSASSLHLAFSFQVSERAIQSSHQAASLLGTWSQGCIRVYCMTVSCFISLVLDSWALRVFLGVCFSKPYCIEFPHACIISHICKHIHKVNSYKWLYLVNAYGYILTAIAKLLFTDSVPDVHSPFPHITQPASLSLPYSNVWACIATWKAMFVKEIEYHCLLFKCLIFPFLYCHLSVQIPCLFLSWSFAYGF